MEIKKIFFEKIGYKDTEYLFEEMNKLDYINNFNQPNIGNSMLYSRDIVNLWIQESFSFTPHEICLVLKNNEKTLNYGLSFYSKINWKDRILFNDIYLSKPYRKKIYGGLLVLYSYLYAIETLNMRKIFYCINENNDEIACFIKRLDWVKQEALLKKELYKNGEYTDVGIYSISSSSITQIKSKYKSLL